MPARRLLSLSVFILILLACRLVGGGSSVPDTGQAVASSTEPISLEVGLDQGHAASAFIGTQGGSLTTTGADGSRFTLEIPPGALIQDTGITMIPITSMTGLPLSGGMGAAVQLEPSGLAFYDFVTLTVDPAQEIALEEQIPIGYSGEDHALTIPFVAPGSQAFQLKLLHFSGAGVGRGLLADLESVRQRLGGDVEDRLNSVLARELAFRRQQGETEFPGEVFDWFFKAYTENVLNPRLAAAGEGCAEARLAIETVLKLERMKQLLGYGGDTGLQQFIDLMPTAARVCIKEEYEMCRDEHIIHRIIPAVLSLKRQSALLGMEGGEIDSVMAEAEDLTRKCLTFDLAFESSVKATGGMAEVTSEVEANVPILYTPMGEIDFILDGEAPLENTKFEPSSALTPIGCTLESATGGGIFNVASLTWTVKPFDADNALGSVEDMKLAYDPGITTEAATITCPAGPEFPPFLGGTWSGNYTLLHMDEGTALMNAAMGNPSFGMNTRKPGSMLATGWVIEGGDIFATREWETSGLTGTENGRFVLFHHPQ
jgi:hypothetical protein